MVTQWAKEVHPYWEVGVISRKAQRVKINTKYTKTTQSKQLTKFCLNNDTF